MTNDELSDIDAKLARGYDLPHELAKTLRHQLAENAMKAVRLEKRIADLERELAEAKEEAWMYRGLCK